MTRYGRSRSEVRPGWGAAKVRGMQFLREPLGRRRKDWATCLQAHVDSIYLCTPAHVWLGTQSPVHTGACTEELAPTPTPMNTYIGTEAHIPASWAGLKPLRSWGALPHCLTFLPCLSSVIVCRCNVEGQCMRKVGRMKGMPTKLSAVGILVGTLIAIGNGGWAPAWGRAMVFRARASR